ncbi:unnamed protein product [Rhizopus stolonifer]
MSFSETMEKPVPAPLPSIHQQIENAGLDKNPDTSNALHPSIKKGMADEKPQSLVPINRELDMPNVPEVTEEQEETVAEKINQWESIFSPQTTFKQNNKGGLEYTGLDISRLSIVCTPQRVYQPELVATIPTIMPTPPLESASDQQDLAGLGSQDGRRFDILRNVLGSSDEQDTIDKTKSNTSVHTKDRLLRSLFTDKHLDVEKQNQKNVYWTQQRLFWTGFAIPPIWFYGSFQKNVTEPLWQKRCRFAAFYFVVIVAVIVLLVAVRTTDGTRRTHSDGIRSVINQ